MNDIKAACLRLFLLCAIALAAPVWDVTASADTPGPAEPSANAGAPAAENSAQARDAEAKAAWDAAIAAATHGPTKVDLRNQATLNLPSDMLFVPAAQSNRLMRAWGNGAQGESFLGLIFPRDTQEDWFMTANFVDAGYIKDADAKTWDTDALLKNATEGVAADNEDRAARGFPKIKVDGWIEKPTYDSVAHQLVYSMALSAADAAAGDGGSVNFHTYALGREGYIAIDLVTSPSAISQFKGKPRAILAGLDYAPGKSYGDYVEGTDRVAEYGIAALIGGFAAHKLGLLALIALTATKFGAWLLAFAKPIAAGAVALVAGIGRLFRRKPKPKPLEPAAAMAPSPNQLPSQQPQD